MTVDENSSGVLYVAPFDGCQNGQERKILVRIRCVGPVPKTQARFGTQRVLFTSLNRGLSVHKACTPGSRIIKRGSNHAGLDVKPEPVKNERDPSGDLLALPVSYSRERVKGLGWMPVSLQETRPPEHVWSSGIQSESNIGSEDGKSVMGLPSNNEDSQLKQQ